MHCTQYNYKQDFQDSLKSVYMFVKHAHVYIILFLQCYGGGSPPAYPLLVMVVIVTGCRDAQQSFKTTSGGSGGGGTLQREGQRQRDFCLRYHSYCQWQRFHLFGWENLRAKNLLEVCSD